MKIRTTILRGAAILLMAGLIAALGSGCTTATTYTDKEGREIRTASNLAGNGTQVVADSVTYHPDGAVTFSGNVVYNASDNTEVPIRQIDVSGIVEIANGSNRLEATKAKEATKRAANDNALEATRAGVVSGANPENAATIGTTLRP